MWKFRNYEFDLKRNLYRLKKVYRFSRYGILGVFNTVISYLLFILLSNYFEQLVSSIIIEFAMQTWRYFALKKFVFKVKVDGRKTILKYYLSILPGSLFLFINIYFLSKYYPPYFTGLIAILISLIYYKIFKNLFIINDK